MTLPASHPVTLSPSLVDDSATLSTSFVHEPLPPCYPLSSTTLSHCHLLLLTTLSPCHLLSTRTLPSCHPFCTRPRSFTILQSTLIYDPAALPSSLVYNPSTEPSFFVYDIVSLPYCHPVSRPYFDAILSPVTLSFSLVLRPCPSMSYFLVFDLTSLLSYLFYDRATLSSSLIYDLGSLPSWLTHDPASLSSTTLLPYYPLSPIPCLLPLPPPTKNPTSISLLSLTISLKTLSPCHMCFSLSIRVNVRDEDDANQPGEGIGRRQSHRCAAI